MRNPLGAPQAGEIRRPPTVYDPQRYDAHGRPQRIIDPNGLVTRIQYDQSGRPDLVSVGDGNGAITNTTTNQLTDHDYDNVGLLKKMTLPTAGLICSNSKLLIFIG